VVHKERRGKSGNLQSDIPREGVRELVKGNKYEIKKGKKIGGLLSNLLPPRSKPPLSEEAR